MASTLDVLVLPISGGAFPLQLSAIYNLLSVQEYSPDITLACSGGNVCAILCTCGRWTINNIDGKIRLLDHSYFSSKYSEMGLYSIILGNINSSLYNHGKNTYDLFKKLFENVTEIDEIWTQTFTNINKVQLFCSKRKDNTIFQWDNRNNSLHCCLEPIYSDGNVDLITKYSLASASIPVLVPSVKIGDYHYKDGGLYSPSPLTIMKNDIIRLFGKYEQLHMVYVSAVNLNYFKNPEVATIIDNCRNSLNSLLKSQKIIDKVNGIEIVKLFAEKKGCIQECREVSFPWNKPNIERLMSRKGRLLCFFLELYPLNNNEVNIFKFTSEDIIKAIYSNYNDILANIWYYGDEILFES